MRLPKIQRKLLRQYEKLRAGSLTIPGVMRLFLVPWLVLLIMAIVGSWVLFSIGVPAAGWFVVGLCVGGFARDIGRVQVLFRTWPVTREIINWERVKDLIQAHDKAL